MHYETLHDRLKYLRLHTLVPFSRVTTQPLSRHKTLSYKLFGTLSPRNDSIQAKKRPRKKDRKIERKEHMNIVPSSFWEWSRLSLSQRLYPKDTFCVATVMKSLQHGPMISYCLLLSRIRFDHRNVLFPPTNLWSSLLCLLCLPIWWMHSFGVSYITYVSNIKQIGVAFVRPMVYSMMVGGWLVILIMRRPSS